MLDPGGLGYWEAKHEAEEARGVQNSSPLPRHDSRPRSGLPGQPAAKTCSLEAARDDSAQHARASTLKLSTSLSFHSLAGHGPT